MHTTTRLRMAHVTCPECGEEVSQPSPTCSKRDAPPAKASRATTPQSVPEQRHKTHPVTWVVTAAIIPLLCWDAWQTYKEARLKMSVDVKFVEAGMRAGEDAHPRGAQAARPLAAKAQSSAAQVAAIPLAPCRGPSLWRVAVTDAAESDLDVAAIRGHC